MDWDTDEEIVKEKKHYQLLELRKLDDGSYEVTQGNTVVMGAEELSSDLSS